MKEDERQMLWSWLRIICIKWNICNCFSEFCLKHSALEKYLTDMKLFYLTDTYTFERESLWMFKVVCGCWYSLRLVVLNTYLVRIVSCPCSSCSLALRLLVHQRVEITGGLLCIVMKKIKKNYAMSSVVLSTKNFFTPLGDGVISSNLFHLRRWRNHKTYVVNVHEN